MTEGQYVSDIFGLLIDDATRRVLMLKDTGGNWTLPHGWFTQRVYLHQVSFASAGLNALLNADLTVLRNVHIVVSSDWKQRTFVYQMENHSPMWKPPSDMYWVRAEELDGIPFANPDHRTVVADALAELVSEKVPALRPPWARPGWYDRATAWMRDQLAAHGYTLTGPITQLKSWGISCLLKAETDQGTIFFKVATSLPLFGNEPALMAALAERYPDAVPPPLAVEPNERWMLMRDFGTVLNAAPTFEKWHKVIEHYGHFQAQTASAIDDLFGVGCLDRRLNVLSNQIDALFADDQALAILSADEIAQIRALAPRLKTMCAELAEFRVPHTLVHGDFHGGNITGESLLFFDWTDACIAHPFLDLCTVMENLEGQKIEGREQILDTYFQAWTQYEPMERLREAWKLAEPLGALHQAVSYQHIVATLEPTSKREMIWGVPEWLQRMLRTMPS